mmetsp:Transcript_15361/g.22677  ORF Transcript_15361/g.22677 Transcript_15361/m.22677 type:complete len:115 (-) Transcript_15361:115-459(-)
MSPFRRSFTCLNTWPGNNSTIMLPEIHAGAAGSPSVTFVKTRLLSCKEGSVDGDLDGRNDGESDGLPVEDGGPEGIYDGSGEIYEGRLDGRSDGFWDGNLEGLRDGVFEGIKED